MRPKVASQEENKAIEKAQERQEEDVKEAGFIPDFGKLLLIQT